MVAGWYWRVIALLCTEPLSATWTPLEATWTPPVQDEVTAMLNEGYIDLGWLTSDPEFQGKLAEMNQDTGFTDTLPDASGSFDGD
jgi:hypothetical protein